MSIQVFVYVVNLPGYGVKIGHSKNPQDRAYGLRMAHGDALSLEFVLESDNACRLECRAHAILKDKRLYGEWFDVSTDEAIFAVRQAEIDFVLDDTPDCIRTGILKKVIDRGDCAGQGKQPPVAPPRPQHRFTSESSAFYRKQRMARQK